GGRGGRVSRPDEVRLLEHRLTATPAPQPPEQRAPSLGRRLPSGVRRERAFGNPPLLVCACGTQLAHGAAYAAVEVWVRALAAQQRATAHVASDVSIDCGRPDGLSRHAGRG